jgi:hypothetical protein
MAPQSDFGERAGPSYGSRYARDRATCRGMSKERAQTKQTTPIGLRPAPDRIARR